MIRYNKFLSLFIFVFSGLFLFSPHLVAYSPLENWNLLRDNYVTDYFVAATSSDNRIVAVGSNFVATSPDGTLWKFRKVCDLCYLDSVAYGNGITVAVGFDAVS